MPSATPRKGLPLREEGVWVFETHSTEPTLEERSRVGSMGAYENPTERIPRPIDDRMVLESGGGYGHAYGIPHGQVDP